jgi:mannose-1-phosphate guanylyltransferase
LPKQFARLLPGDSLFEATVKRNLPVAHNVQLACNKDQYYLAANQLHGLGIPGWKTVVEPVGRNTAPAIALACLMLPPEEVLLVSPSDHVIANKGAYIAAVERAIKLAVGGKLVTFGIKPLFPETGFGYIQTDPVDTERVVSFREKPDEETAKAYLASGNYWWNSGMFCFTAKTFLAELERLSPEVFRAARRAWDNAVNHEPFQPSETDMRAIPAISIDYAVLEKSDRVACVCCDIGWSDLGSFDALYDHLQSDQTGLSSSDVSENALACGVDPVLVNSRNNLVINGERMVALVDVEDLLVVESHDALLIAKRGSSQKVKEVVDTLKARKSDLTEFFPKVERPWGNYAVLHEEPGFKVQRIEIAPGQRMSLQRHEHREEHWTVVSGEAIVQIERSRKPYVSGQTIMVAQHAIHRLENPGAVPVVLIETQLGAYLGEDDIERLQDDYNR